MLGLELQRLLGHRDAHWQDFKRPPCTCPMSSATSTFSHGSSGGWAGGGQATRIRSHAEPGLRTPLQSGRGHRPARFLVGGTPFCMIEAGRGPRWIHPHRTSRGCQPGQAGVRRPKTASINGGKGEEGVDLGAGSRLGGGGVNSGPRRRALRAAASVRDLESHHRAAHE